jgi:Tol biopolymer transport system component
MKVALFALLLIAAPAVAQRKSGSPLDHLPSNMEILTYFGERADFSPDNKSIAFMDKSFGDAFVIDLATRRIHCLTCSIPGAAFLRVMHLSNGDFLLIGPEKFTDIHTSRTRDNELWYLSRNPGSKPVRLGEKMSEGAAVSKHSMKIAVAEMPQQFADIPAGSSRMITADLDLSGPTPKLINREVIYESHTNACGLEAQDFHDNDSKLTFICYNHKDLPPNADEFANVMDLDLQTGKATNMTQHDGSYNEVEGIFPDGQHTCVESDRQDEQLGGRRGSHNIDIWKLRLDGTGKDFVRLTHFNDYEGWKASNPVVSTDGKYMAFQVAQTKDEAGVGYGLILSHL